jgi:hypothetical protein
MPESTRHFVLTGDSRLVNLRQSMKSIRVHLNNETARCSLSRREEMTECTVSSILCHQTATVQLVKRGIGGCSRSHLSGMN